MRLQRTGKHAWILLAAALVALMAAFTATAEEPEPQKRKRTVLKSTMHVEVREVVPILRILNVEFAIKEDQNTIVIRAEEGYMDTALAVIEALDTPRPSFDVRVFVVAASQEETGRTGITEGLESALSQLQGVFGYRGFTLLDSVSLRVMEGRNGRIDGGVYLGGSDVRTGYRLSFDKAHLVSEPDGPPGPERREGDVWRVRLDGLSFIVGDDDAGAPRAQLRTDVQFIEGQKAVIGSSTPEGIGETLILIIEAEVLG